MPLLTVIVPVYNEKNTIRQILAKIDAVNIDKEVIVVDDGSNDGTDKILREIKNERLKIIHHTSNRGKGAAVLTGLMHSQGEFVIIQDADLEYDPDEYKKMVDSIGSGCADIVLGARFLKGRQGMFIHQVGNEFLTGFLNLLFGSSLNDYATCYKIAKKSTWDSLGLRAKGFDIDVEIVCNALKNKKRLLEVEVSYSPRSYKEGKKIRWRDALWALYYMLKYRFST